MHAYRSDKVSPACSVNMKVGSRETVLGKLFPIYIHWAGQICFGVVPKIPDIGCVDYAPNKGGGSG